MNRLFNPRNLMTKGCAADIAGVLQPFIVAGLMMEDSSSLTRAILLDHAASALAGWSLFLFGFSALISWLDRYIFNGLCGPSAWAKSSFRFLGVCMAIVAAIAMDAESTSGVLIAGYLASATYCLWISAIEGREVGIYKRSSA